MARKPGSLVGTKAFHHFLGKRRIAKRRRNHAAAAPRTHLDRYLAGPQSVQLPSSVKLKLPLHCDPIFALQLGKKKNDLQIKEYTHGLWQHPQGNNVLPTNPTIGLVSIL